MMSFLKYKYLLLFKITHNAADTRLPAQAARNQIAQAVRTCQASRTVQTPRRGTSGTRSAIVVHVSFKYSDIPYNAYQYNVCFRNIHLDWFNMSCMRFVFFYTFYYTQCFMIMSIGKFRSEVRVVRQSKLILQCFHTS